MNIVHLMLEYQKKNNIKGKCFTNSLYLKDYLTIILQLNVKMKAVIAISKVKFVVNYWIHVVIEVDGKIIDPSYETSQYNPIYVDTIVKALPLIGCEVSKKEIIENFLNFTKIVKEINDNVYERFDNDYYMTQAEYIKMKLKEK